MCVCMCAFMCLFTAAHVCVWFAHISCCGRKNDAPEQVRSVHPLPFSRYPTPTRLLVWKTMPFDRGAELSTVERIRPRCNKQASPMHSSTVQCSTAQYSSVHGMVRPWFRASIATRCVTTFAIYFFNFHKPQELVVI